MPLVAISGGFDPLHVGHIRLIRGARKYGDVAVILNSDRWLVRKKGHFFMCSADRAEILLALKGIASVHHADDEDSTVRAALRRMKPTPDFFANGGDRTKKSTPELDLCRELGITCLFEIGGGKARSSTELVARYEARRG